jgi:hypothetical protein
VTSEESALKTGIISVVFSILLGATSAAVSAEGAERFILTGMVVWSGNEGVAWLQEPDLTRNETVALRIGQSVGPWKLTRFLDNGIELDGPAGKVLIPLQNAGGGGTAVAAGAPAGSGATPAPTAATLPKNDASRVATQPAPANQAPGYAGESNPPTPNASALTEAFNRARASRAQRQAENPPDQPREAGPAAGSQAERGPGTSSAAKSSGGVTGGAAGGGSNQNVIQFPVGGGSKGIRELFGSR